MDYAKMISAARYECVVCHLKSVTISELHRHQTFRHTTEELSLSTIGLRTSLNYGPIRTDGTGFARSWLSEPQKHSAFYAYSAVLLGHENVNADFDRCVPLDYVLDKKDFQPELDPASDGGPSESRPEKIPHWRPARRRRWRGRASNKGVLDLSRPERFGKKKPAAMDADRKFLDCNSVAETPAIAASKKKRPGQSSRERKTIAVRKRTAKFKNRTVKGGKKERKDNEAKISSQDIQDDWKDAGSGKEEKDRAAEGDYESTKRRTNRKLLTRRNGLRPDKIEPDNENDGDEIAAENGTARSSKKNGSVRRKKVSSYRISRSSRARKIVSEIENEGETSWKENCEISNISNVRVDRVCLDVSEGSPAFLEDADSTGLDIHPQNLLPDVAQEVSVDDDWTRSPLVDDDDDETSRPVTKHLVTVDTFPPYPGNMDERTILVLDPTTCKLVWTSFELLDESISVNDNETFQNVEDPGCILESDSLMHHDYVATERTRSSGSSWMAPPREENDSPIGNEAHEDRPETNEVILANEEDDSSHSSEFGSMVPLPLLEKCEEVDDTSNPSCQQELRRNEKIVENEENLQDSNYSRISERSAPNIRSFLKSRVKQNTLKQSMPEQLRAESNDTTLAEGGNLKQTIFSQRSKRNRIATRRYVPY